MIPSSAPATPAAGKSAAKQVVLAGNPNSGKTTLFNVLTGLRGKSAITPA